jgi:hypothetical protein
MDKDIEVIVQGCNNKDYSRAEEEDFSDEYGTTKAYKVQGEDQCLYYWNSSNQQAPQHAEALRYIAEELESGTENGSVADGWNEIMFEVK